MTPRLPADRLRELSRRPAGASPLVMVTAYDFTSARVAEAAGVDLILVGDSAGTTILGYQSTRDVGVDELLVLTRAAVRGVRETPVIGDLPFGTYEASDALAVATARRFAEAGCAMVKLEGAGAMLDRVRAIVSAGIPVMGHVGLLPQSAERADALRAQGRTAEAGLRIVDDAEALVQAGCTLLVVEAVPSAVAAACAERVSVPVIGIGAGAKVGGQVLVLHDLIGLTEGHTARFVRQYAQVGQVMREAVAAWASDVRRGAYPASREEYGMPDDQAERFAAALATRRGSSEG